VLSTLHTNSAPETVTRLMEMGMDPFLIADGLLGVLAQRLTKRLCARCRRERIATADELDKLAAEYATDMTRALEWQKDPLGAVRALRAEWAARFGGAGGAITLYEPGTCDECSGTGYNGRVALHELLVVNDELKRAIQERARSSLILELALAAGMHTLRQDGILKVLAGHTDMRRVRAVCAR